MVIYTKTVWSSAKMLSCHEYKLNTYIYAYFQKLQMRKMRISLWKCWNYLESLRFIVLRLGNFIHIELGGKRFWTNFKWRHIIHESSALQKSMFYTLCFCCDGYMLLLPRSCTKSIRVQRISHTHLIIRKVEFAQRKERMWLMTTPKVRV